MELAPSGIKVSLIGPGAIATPIWEKSLAAADETIRRMPEEGQKLYGAMIGGVRDHQAALGMHGISAEAVARVAAHALTAPNPARRYAVGADARGAEVLRLVPAAVRERLILRHMGLTRREN